MEDVSSELKRMPIYAEEITGRTAFLTPPQEEEDYMDQLIFYLNGKKRVLSNPDPDMTLLDYVRSVGLTGTKLGCGEGGCGACTVILSSYDTDNRRVSHATVNACLAPLICVDGKHVITIEGVGTSKHPHIVQKRLAHMHGSQCGFCTPGIAMSLYAIVRNGNLTETEIEEGFDGNLCRCTGYRPILDAARTFMSPVMPQPVGGEEEAMGDGCGRAICCKMGGKRECGLTRSTTAEEAVHAELIFPAALRNYNPSPLRFGTKGKRWFRPVTLQQVLQLKCTYPQAKLVGGNSEVQIEVKFKASEYTTCIYLSDIKELKQATSKEQAIFIGANLELEKVRKYIVQAIESYEAGRTQILRAMLEQLRYFAGKQIRNVASLAGNIATASPISDINPVLVAGGASLHYILPSGVKSIMLMDNAFFNSYRNTALPVGAVITAIEIPIPQTEEHVRAYKQAKRTDDDIAIVTAGMRVVLDDNRVVQQVTLAYGGMAPWTVTAERAMGVLLGKLWGEEDVLDSVLSALMQDFDLSFDVPGGMATYRRALAMGFFVRFWYQIASEIGLKVGAVETLERGISRGQRDNANPVVRPPHLF